MRNDHVHQSQGDAHGEGRQIRRKHGGRPGNEEVTSPEATSTGTILFFDRGENANENALREPTNPAEQKKPPTQNNSDHRNDHKNRSRNRNKIKKKKKDSNKEKKKTKNGKKNKTKRSKKNSGAKSSKSSSSKSSKSSSKSRKLTNAPTLSPTYPIQLSVQPNLVMGLFGITELTESEVVTFEEQTANFMQDFYNYDAGAIFDVVATVEVTDTFLEASDMVGGQRFLQDNPLIVKYTTEITYRTSDPNLDAQSLVSEPFASEESRNFFVDQYLKADGEFQDLSGISPIEFPQPTEYPTISPTFNPTIELDSDPDVIVNTTFHLSIVQDFLLNITASDTKEIEETTLKFLFDNVGGEAKFQPQRLTISEIASDNQIIKEGSGEEKLIETIAFKMNAMFSLKASFVEWIEEGQEGDDDIVEGSNEIEERQLFKSRAERFLAKGKCNANDYCECCLNGSINKNADSKTCKAAGCNRKRCKKKPPKNRRLSSVIEDSYNDISQIGTRKLEIDDNLYGRDFLEVIRQYTTNFKPNATKSILNATDTESVATCSSSRYADSTNSSSFACDVYEVNNCEDNEDIDFERDEQICSSAQPSTSPTNFPSSSPTISSMPTFSSRPTPAVSYCVSSTFFDGFESGSFPEYPWQTGGNGSWRITDNRTYEGSYSITTPNFEGIQVPVSSNATIQTCPEFPGGNLTCKLLAGVQSPYDAFFLYIDGQFRGSWSSWDDFTTLATIVPPGYHIIDFQYVYYGYDSEPSPPDRLGAVWIDNVAIVTSSPTQPPAYIAPSRQPTATPFPSIAPVTGSIPTRHPVASCNNVPKAIYDTVRSVYWVEDEQELSEYKDAEFGYSISMWGNVTVIGAPGAKSGINHPGAVYVFEYKLNDPSDGVYRWIFIEKLTPSVSDGDRVGESVSIFGEFLVVGAPFNDQMAVNGGLAHVFRRQEGSETFQQLVTLISPAPQENAFFGISVVVDEDGDVAVGAVGERSFRGTCYVFGRVLSNWNLVQTFQPDVASAPDIGNFGWSLAMDRSFLVVGAPYENASGSVFIYEEQTTDSWVFTDQISPVDGGAGDLFGLSVDFDSGNLIVGSPFASTSQVADAGRVYHYLLSPLAGASFSSRIDAVESVYETTGVNFGFSVSLSGNLLLIGCPFSTLDNIGSAHLFYQEGGDQWLFSQIILDNPVVENFRDSLFGFSVAVNLNHVLVGMPLFDDVNPSDDSSVEDSGAALFFEVAEINECVNSSN